MITIVKASDCSYFRISHSDIENHDDTYTLELVITDETDGAANTVIIKAVDITNPGTEDAYYQHTLSNGIYGLSLVKTVGTTKTFTNACLFLDCDIRCKAVSTDIETSMLHYSLSLAEECDCDCINMKEPYELLLQKLEENPCTSC